jgi:hypothetical protein
MMVNQIKTDIFGLKYYPSFKNEQDNDADCLREYNDYVQLSEPYLPLYHGENLEFTIENNNILIDCIKNLGRGFTNVLEIGMSRNPEPSSTPTILKYKLP